MPNWKKSSYWALTAKVRIAVKVWWTHNKKRKIVQAMMNLLKAVTSIANLCDLSFLILRKYLSSWINYQYMIKSEMALMPIMQKPSIVVLKPQLISVNLRSFRNLRMITMIVLKTRSIEETTLKREIFLLIRFKI